MFYVHNVIMLSLIIIMLSLRAEILMQSKSNNLNKPDYNLVSKIISVQVNKYKTLINLYHHIYIYI